MSKRKDSKGRVLKDGERERSNGSGYEYRYQLRGKTKSLYSVTLEGLREKENELKKNILDGIHVSNRNMTLNNAYEKWKEVKRGLKNNTFSNYKYMYERYVYDSFGKEKIKDVKRSDIKSFYITLVEERGLKPNTIDCIQNIIYQLFDMLVDDDIIRSNPAQKALSELKKDKELMPKHKTALTVNQEKEILDFIKNSKRYNSWYPLFVFMFRTGLRIGEVCALQNSDIDWEHNIINVNHTLVYFDRRDAEHKHCGYEIHSPKTEAGKRIVPMIKEVQDALIQEKKRQEEFEIECTFPVDGYDDFVFMNRFGRPYNFGTVNKAIKTLVNKCNENILTRDNGKQDNLVPRFSCHITRHSFATRANEANMNDKARQAILGHKSIETTNNIYTDATEELLKNEYQRLEDYLSNL